MTDRIKTFKEFWPYYLNEHAKPLTRAIHLAGTGASIALLGAAVVTGQWWLPVAAVAAGYGSAWTAHAFVERNKPATFTYPLWSLKSDFKMFGHFITGTLKSEVEQHVTKTPDAKPAPQSFGKSVIERVKGLKQRFTGATQPKGQRICAKPPQPPAPAP